MMNKRACYKRKVFLKTLNQTQESFNIKALSAGVYSLQIITATEKTNLKFIKAK